MAKTPHLGAGRGLSGAVLTLLVYFFFNGQPWLSWMALGVTALLLVPPQVLLQWRLVLDSDIASRHTAPWS
jgi:hypothetical protein